MDLTVTDNLYEARYEASFNGELAGTLEYELTSDLLILIHTEVLPGHQDKGVGGRLARFALEDAQAGLRDLEYAVEGMKDPPEELVEAVDRIRRALADF